jgi:hypothetical protein
MSNAEDYLKKNVKDILQPMIKKIIEDKPSDPVTNSLINIT